MGTEDFGLHDILIYERKNTEGKGGKYLEKKDNCDCGGEGKGGKFLFFRGEKTNKENVKNI